MPMLELELRLIVVCLLRHVNCARASQVCVRYFNSHRNFRFLAAGCLGGKIGNTRPRSKASFPSQTSS